MHEEGEPSVAEAQIRERIKLILQERLRLGPNAAITDDMPLVGGPYDLDSLDILLLVTSIEKEFGVKIEDKALGREVFQSVNALAAFVDAQTGSP